MAVREALRRRLEGVDARVANQIDIARPRSLQRRYVLEKDLIERRTAGASVIGFSTVRASTRAGCSGRRQRRACLVPTTSAGTGSVREAVQDDRVRLERFERFQDSGKRERRPRSG